MNLKIILTLFICTLSLEILSSEAIGFYSKGSIKNSASVDHYEGHFEKLFRNRKQLYSTDFLLSFVKNISIEIKKKYPDVEKLQFGDISSITGGKINRHQSHQNGLDIDIVYLRVNKTGQSTTNPEWGEYFTKDNKLTKNFDLNRNWELFKLMVSKENVGRIFVDWAVKNKYCSLYKNSSDDLVKETLRRLRPAKYHKTHLHLRLNCPKTDSRCRKQAPPNRTTGCSNLINESL
jgi:penicillin-insensitive murein endopeptidase